MGLILTFQGFILFSYFKLNLENIQVSGFSQALLYGLFVSHIQTRYTKQLTWKGWLGSLKPLFFLSWKRCWYTGLILGTFQASYYCVSALSPTTFLSPAVTYDDIQILGLIYRPPGSSRFFRGKTSTQNSTHGSGHRRIKTISTSPLKSSITLWNLQKALTF